MEIQLPLGRNNLNLSVHERNSADNNCSKDHGALNHDDDFYREVFGRDYVIGKFHFHVRIWSAAENFMPRF